jgi:putative lipoprotein
MTFNLGRSWLAVLVLAGACAGGEPAAGTLAGTSWSVEDIERAGVLDHVQTTLSFDGDQGVYGSGGCNRFVGPVEVKADTIRFGNIASTMMACPPEVMEQEQRFFASLREAVRWKTTPEDKLLLSNAAGAPVAVFGRLPTKPSGG